MNGHLRTMAAALAAVLVAGCASHEGRAAPGAGMAGPGQMHGQGMCGPGMGMGMHGPGTGMHGQGMGMGMAGAMPAANPAQLAQMDEHLRAMQRAHARMTAAKTPEERKALMAGHQAAMREGMAAMHAAMGAGTPGSGCIAPEMAKRHQAMMQMMMQMMAETPQAPAQAPK